MAFSKNNNAILEDLFNLYYKQDVDCPVVTSSHWKEFGKHKVTYKGSKWRLKGVGFGDWADDTLINRLRMFSVSNMVHTMKRDYECPDYLWKVGMFVAKSSGRIFSFDCAKQVIAVSFIIKNITNGKYKKQNPFSSAGIEKICVIGDGYGYIGSLIKALDCNVVITSVNLGKSLLFDVYCTNLVFPNAEMIKAKDINTVKKHKVEFIFIPAESYALLDNMPQELIINIASMQEMSISVVNKYMKLIRRYDEKTPYFYCCNRIKKQLPNGEIIRFDDYGWKNNDNIIVDELCQWYQNYPKGILHGWKSFDGPIRHRLVKLGKY